MAHIPQRFLEATNRSKLAKTGGVLFLKTYWQLTHPTYLDRINKREAEIIVKEDLLGVSSMFIHFVFNDNSYEDLPLIANTELDEGDTVDINSIIVIIQEEFREEVSIHYDCICIEKQQKLCYRIIREFFVKRCIQLIKRIPTFKLHKEEKEYDYSSYNYWEDTTEKEIWYAMTDGLEGDMPEGFDGDFEALGY